MSILGQPVQFLREVQEELGRVTWPSQKEVIKLTAIVLSVSLVTGFLLGGVDFVLTKITEVLIQK